MFALIWIEGIGIYNRGSRNLILILFAVMGISVIYCFCKRDDESG